MTDYMIAMSLIIAQLISLQMHMDVYGRRLSNSLLLAFSEISKSNKSIDD